MVITVVHVIKMLEKGLSFLTKEWKYKKDPKSQKQQTYSVSISWFLNIIFQ